MNEPRLSKVVGVATEHSYKEFAGWKLDQLCGIFSSNEDLL
jgi:hypothetical protein